MKLLRIILIVFVVLANNFNILADQRNLDSLANLAKTAPIDSLAKIYNDMALELINTDSDSAFVLAQKALELAVKFNNKREIMYANDGLGNIYNIRGINDKALAHWEESLKISIELEEKRNTAYFQNSIGVIYKKQGKYQQAIEYFQKSYDTQEQLGNHLQMGMSAANIANIYWAFGIDFEKALKSNFQALEMFEKAGRQVYVATIMNNIGLVYKSMKDYDKAIEYYNKSLKKFQENNSLAGVAQAQNNIGTIYLERGNYTLALSYSQSSYETYRKIGDNVSAAMSLRDIASAHFKAGNYTTALNYFRQSFEIQKQMALKKEMLDTYKSIAEVYSVMGNFKSAYQNYIEYSALKDSIMGEEYMKQMQELEVIYETDKKEKEIQLKNADLAQKDIEAKRQKLMIYGLGFIILMVIAFAFVLYRQFAEKKKANILLAAQNDEIKLQRDQIFQQKKEITDSIHYASRIQRAVLPATKILEDYNLQYFILYKPRDIVSGDFYWINQKDNKIIIAAADCTGHGVPGAFMSMLGMAFLNEIVTKADFSNAAEMLDQLRALVVKSLHQSGRQEETKDGMDMALMMVDVENSMVQFAGAFNPMYLIRNGELIEGPADRMPVGFHDRLGTPFTNTKMPIQKNDTLYIFSDGYVDQFGGENGKKFMVKKFKQLLLDLQPEAMETQRDILDKTIVDWRGELDQVDDILVIGIRL